MFRKCSALAFTITLHVLVNMCSSSWAAVPDIVEDVFPDNKTSIVSMPSNMIIATSQLHTYIPRYDQHALLETVLQCCSKRFSAFRMDLSNIYDWGTLLNRKDQVNGIKYFGSANIMVSLPLDERNVESVRNQLEKLLHNGQIHDTNSIVLNLPLILGNPTTSRVKDRELQRILRILPEIKSFIGNHTTSNSSLLLGLEPLGYAEEDGVYLSTDNFAARFAELFDFMIIPIPIHSLIYTYAQFQTEIEKQVKPVIRRIRLFRAKPELILNLRFDLSKENISDWRARQRSNQMMARFAYRYGAENDIRAQFPLFQFQDGGGNATSLGVDIEEEPIQKIVVLNEKLTNNDVSYPQLETFLTVISRDFSTILINSPNPNSNISNLLRKVNKFNRARRSNLTFPISVIVRHLYTPAGRYEGSISHVKQLLDELNTTNHKFPGIVSGAIIQFYYHICYTGLYEDELPLALNETNGWQETQVQDEPRTFPILALGCERREDPNDDVIKLMKNLADDANSMPFYASKWRKQFGTLEEALEYLEHTRAVKVARGFSKLWVEIGWSDDYTGIGRDCSSLVHFYEMAMSWAKIHQVNLIIKEAFDSSYEGDGWYKRLGLPHEWKTERVEEFVPRIEDPCVTVSKEVNQERLSFTWDTAVSINVNERELSPMEFGVVVQIVTLRFQSLEFVVTDMIQASRIIQILTNVQATRHDDQPHNAYINFIITELDFDLKDFQIFEQSILQAGESVAKLSIHLDAGYDEGGNCSQSFLLTENHSQVTFLKRMFVGNGKYELGFVFKLTQSSTTITCPPQFLNSFDYILLDIDLAEFIVSYYYSTLASRFATHIQNNDLRNFQNAFDTIRNFRLDIQKIKPDLEVKLRFRWPTTAPINPQDREFEKLVYGNMLRYWKFVDEFCTTFNFSYVIYPALEPELGQLVDSNEDSQAYSKQVGAGAGWWRILNYTNLSDLSVYEEKESKYFGLETPKPISVFLLPDTWSNGTSSNNDNGMKQPIWQNLVGAALLFCLLITVIIILSLGLRNRYVILSKEEIRAFVKGSKPSEHDYEESTGENKFLGLAYNLDLEIGKEEFRPEKGEIIGMGNFGIVYKADIPRFNDPVAVKVPRGKKGSEEGEKAFKNLLSEIKIMSCLNEHENVVKILGAYTKEIRKGIVFMVTEYCSMGSLKDYLRSLVPSQDPSQSQREVFTRELYGFARQIVAGMEYISSKNMIHGDLATRNILLSADKTCKICDFGLARKLDDYGKYMKDGSDQLPWRMMAVESLKKMEFSIKSDVWSFGVTVWEIFTLGDVPFPEKSWSNEFVNELENGLRLPCPKYSTGKLYKTLCRCWELEPAKRPTFIELGKNIQALISNDYTQLLPVEKC